MMQKIFPYTAIALLFMSLTTITGCVSGSKKTETKQEQRKNTPGGPRLGQPGGGPTIDKTDDKVLQAMIQELVPQFKQSTYVDNRTGDSLRYNLFQPQSAEPGKSYPLVLFMADASTPGTNTTLPLTQGYGALVWATAKSQAQHPCYVLVPQYAGTVVNDAYEHTSEAEMTIGLLKEVVTKYNVDNKRLYTTGQSMGGMMSMYFNIAYPDVFAASLFVDCHWDTTKFNALVDKKFVWVTAGHNGKSWPEVGYLKALLQKDSISYSFAEWSARLPQTEQDALATALLSRGNNINIITFSPGSVLPESGKGSEHMYSFDYAYRLTPVRNWLFRQSR